MAEHRMLKAEELEVGMEVAYPTYIWAGWHRYYRHQHWKGYTVKRITPKRTKVILLGADGKEMDVDLRKHDVYAIDEAMNSDNKMVNMYQKSMSILSAYDNGWWKSLESLPDDDLEAVNTLLTALDVIMRKEKD